MREVRRVTSKRLLRHMTKSPGTDMASRMAGQMVGHILKNRKSTESLKNRFWPRNLKSCRVADSARNDDIWPEMGS